VLSPDWPRHANGKPLAVGRNLVAAIVIASLDGRQLVQTGNPLVPANTQLVTPSSGGGCGGSSSNGGSTANTGSGSGSDPGGASSSASSAPAIWAATSAKLDPTALPLHDGDYATSPQQGLVFICDPHQFEQTNGPGAKAQGDWVNAAAKTYDITKKIFVQGTVYFPNAELTITPTGTERLIVGNGLPVGVPTGVFPVQANDPAYQYDPNPNSITAQNISFSIPRNPTVNSQPSCTYKRIGITLDGIALHLPFDSQGRDELAYQLQDTCTGAPEPGGSYHRHALGECLPHIHEPVALVGYALDGFGIYSPFDQDGNELVSADLDECHGTTSDVPWEGQTVNMYHYVMTRDFPYTVACFRGTPTRNAFPSLPGAPPEK
jgi:hypothetical protein